MRWCARCILPDTRPGLEIGPDGECSACKAHRTRAEIDWAARSAAFLDVAENARSRSSGYDCVIPVSGGKDSTWQVITCLEHGLRPLAVTWRPPGRTELGRRNLDNLISLGVDHIDYSISPLVEKRFTYRTLTELGSPAVPMHLALFNIPLKIAASFEVPLVVWGENSAFEYGGEDDESSGFRMDREWLDVYGVTHGTTAADWVDEDLSEQDLVAYAGPDPDELAREGILAVFLGYYFPWDPRETFAVARRHGFEARSEGPRTGLYDFADVDDRFVSVHHFLKWYKFGFTRTFDNLSLEIRNGRLTRAEAVDIVRERGLEMPTEDIAALCSFLDMTPPDFFAIAERFRNLDIWTFGPDGVPVIQDFLVEDWDWHSGPALPSAPVPPR